MELLLVETQQKMQNKIKNINSWMPNLKSKLNKRFIDSFHSRPQSLETAWKKKARVEWSFWAFAVELLSISRETKCELLIYRNSSPFAVCRRIAAYLQAFTDFRGLFHLLSDGSCWYLGRHLNKRSLWNVRLRFVRILMSCCISTESTPFR